MYDLVICDLGGVLYNIDFRLTQQAFQNLSGYNGYPIEFGVDHQDKIFMEYDKGEVSTKQFLDVLRKNLGFTCSDSEIEKAWCAVLKGRFPFAEDFVTKLRACSTRTVLLSNISELHLRQANQTCLRLFSLFDECYFSCKIGKRKPDEDAFLHACETLDPDSHKILLIDDSPANCISAQNLGIRTLNVTDPYEVEVEFDSLNV